MLISMGASLLFGRNFKMKCPYCKSERVISCGYDDEAMEIWKCMNCHESFTRSDLVEVVDDDDDDDIGI